MNRRPIFPLSMICLIAAGPTTRPDAERLTVDVRQRESKPRRESAVAELRTMLSTDPARQATALAVLQQTGDIPYDRAGLDRVVVGLLSSPDAKVRAAALNALGAVHADQACLPAVEKLAGDTDPAVRAAVVGAMAEVGKFFQAGDPIPESPVLQLLGDKEPKVVVASAQRLWAVPVSPAVEQKVIELSRVDPPAQPSSSSTAYTMNYYVLSTRPVVSRPVAERLAEIIADPNLPGWHGRAVWGLGNHQIAPDAADVACKALSKEVDESLNPSDRNWALRGLGMLKTPDAMKKLEDVAARDESDDVRRAASQYLRR